MKGIVCRHTTLTRPRQLADLLFETANETEREREEKGKRINLFILIRSNARRIGTNNNHRLARASSAPLKSDLRSFRFVFIYTTRCDFELFVLFLDFHLFLFRAKVRTREIP